MQKVYLLLRDNRETGPFTIDELLQQHLLPDDLIWVEGKSHAWIPLKEMLLTPQIEEAPQPPTASSTADTRIPRNQSPSEIPRPMSTEEKAEALRKRALSFRPVVDFRPVENESRIPLLHLPGEESIEFVDHRKDKYSRQAEVLTGGFFAILVVGGLFFGPKLIREKQDLPTSVSTQIITGESNTAKAEKDTAISAPLTQDSLTQPLPLNSAPSLKSKPAVVKKPVTRLLAETNTEEAEIGNPSDTPRKKDNEIRSLVIPKTVELSEKKEIVAEPPKENTAGTDEKKKTFGQAIKGIFKKKKDREKQEE